MKKVCKTCGVEANGFDECLLVFLRDKKHSTGFRSKCKKCRRKKYQKDRGIDIYTDSTRNNFMYDEDECRILKPKQSSYNVDISEVQKRKPTPASDRQRDSQYRIRYGITLDEYNNMFEHQNGCCKICGTHQADLKNRLSVDHCHTSGAVRGLLCDRCNTALGLFDDDEQVLENALKYIKDSK
jgi:hypothetical protein